MPPSPVCSNGATNHERPNVPVRLYVLPLGKKPVVYGDYTRELGYALKKHNVDVKKF